MLSVGGVWLWTMWPYVSGPDTGHMSSLATDLPCRTRGGHSYHILHRLHIVHSHSLDLPGEGERHGSLWTYIVQWSSWPCYRWSPWHYCWCPPPWPPWTRSRGCSRRSLQVHPRTRLGRPSLINLQVNTNVWWPFVRVISSLWLIFHLKCFRMHSSFGKVPKYKCFPIK